MLSSRSKIITFYISADEPLKNVWCFLLEGIWISETCCVAMEAVQLGSLSDVRSIITGGCGGISCCTFCAPSLAVAWMAGCIPARDEKFGWPGYIPVFWNSASSSYQVKFSWKVQTEIIKYISLSWQCIWQCIGYWVEKIATQVGVTVRNNVQLRSTSFQLLWRQKAFGFNRQDASSADPKSAWRSRPYQSRRERIILAKARAAQLVNISAVLLLWLGGGLLQKSLDC